MPKFDGMWPNDGRRRPYGCDRQMKHLESFKRKIDVKPPQPTNRELMDAIEGLRRELERVSRVEPRLLRGLVPQEPDPRLVGLIRKGPFA